MGLQDSAASGQTFDATARTLPVHLRYAKPRHSLLPEEPPPPSKLAAELKGIAHRHAALTRPRVVALFNMSDFTHHTDSVVPLEEPMFQPSPPEVVFDEFEPLQQYSTILTFRNNDNVARRLKVLAPDSTAFTIEPPKQLKVTGGKVAPGMEVQFRVHFAPRASQDYACDLACVTEREKFLVSLRARGPRPCFEFPDAVDFGLQPVRVTAQEAFLLRNTGAKEGRFSLSVPEPFAVMPSDGVLGAGQATQLLFTFLPEENGMYQEELLITYDSGEQCIAQLTGSASDVNVTLERSLVTLDPCYISLTSQRTVKLYNRSDVRVNFEWKQHESKDEELRVRMGRIRNGDSSDMSAAGQSLARQKRRAIELDPMLFEAEAFSIEPAQGEIYPGGYCELTVIFKPQVVASLSGTAYCAVSGRQARLPLMMKGTSLGSRATWLYDSLDMGDVYVNSQHRYEVVLENHGEIEATYSLAPKDSLLGSCFRFTPDAGVLQPREQVMCEVGFRSGTLGEVHETFHCILKGQPIPLPLTFKGRVVGPSFHFSVGEIDFGTVSIGFQASRMLSMYNTSDIPMKFRLRIPEENPARPEFTIEPERGAILPHRKVNLQVHFCSLNIWRYDLALLVDVEGVGEELLALPILADNVLPNIAAAEPVVDFGDCFRRHGYKRIVRFVNKSP